MKYYALFLQERSFWWKKWEREVEIMTLRKIGLEAEVWKQMFITQLPNYSDLLQGLRHPFALYSLDIVDKIIMY